LIRQTHFFPFRGRFFLSSCRYYLWRRFQVAVPWCREFIL
jgi:hypothetical protein